MKKKILPVLIVFCLIIVVAVLGVLTSVIQKHTPSKEKMDGQEYFGLESKSDAALVVDRQLTEEKVKIVDGRYYVADTVVGTYINSRFYWDEQQKVMLYSLPTEVVQIAPNSMNYSSGTQTIQTNYVILRAINDVFYMDLEFINRLSPIEYHVYENPARVVIQTGEHELQAVKALEHSEIRKKGGIKSLIVDEIEKGETLYLEDQMETWSRVSTEDGYTGYIKNEDISAAEQVTLSFTRDLPEYTSIHKDYKINLGWHQVTSMGANENLTSVLEKAQGLNTISPTWFSVIDNGGSISSLASETYVQTAHAAGLEVWGLIDNFSASADTFTFLSSTNARNYIIEQLMQEAARVGLDGINLDFENITKSQAPHYVQFIRELSIACRLNGLVFSIDNPVPMPYNAHYDLAEQGAVADYVIIMGYDEHHERSEDAGSVASIGFVEDGITGTLKEVPKEKVINGVPFYTRVWIESFGGGVTSETLGMQGALNYVERNGMEVYWDTEAGQNVAMLESEDAIYLIWMEDAKSIEEKMKLIQKYELAGVASWKLGLEHESVWPVIAQYLK